MIVVRVKRDQTGHVTEFSVLGHSGYAARGQDIVCAGVSAIVQTAVLGLQNILAIDCAGSQTDGQLICQLPILETTKRQQADLLLETMLLGLLAIEQLYTDFVQILDLKEV